MKRFVRDILTLCLLAAATFALDRAGVFHAAAARLEPAAPSADWLSRESAAYLPPKGEAGRTDRILPAMPAPAPPSPSPRPRTDYSDRALPGVHHGGSQPVDCRTLLNAEWPGMAEGAPPAVLILHTHSCEAYTPEDPGETASADYRTLDESRSVIAVGDTLTETLEALGFTVFHDRTLYDYPAYNGAYDRSGAAAEAWLAACPEIGVVIDLHRDALGGKRTEYLLTDGRKSAQVMLLFTTGENGLSHPDWKENLKLGLKLQSEMETVYPGLARELYLSPARYNQQLCIGSFLVEVGTEANTLSEAKLAAELLGACIASVLG